MATLTYDFEGLFAPKVVDGVRLDEAAMASLDAALVDARAAVVGAHESGSLGFMNCPLEDVSEISAWSKSILEGGKFTDQIVVGIGGSSLGALAVLASQGGDAGGLKTHFSENIDPVGFARLFGQVDLSTTMIVVITKSGTTIETMSKFWILYEALVEAVGAEAASAHVVAITDPEKGSLRPLAAERGFKTFSVPPNVGGRFSVLTAVGLVPLALAGYDIDALLEGARTAREHALGADVARNALLKAAAHQYLLAARGVNQCVMMSYADDLLPLADWFRQLWAESLGKKTNRAGEVVNVGITPLKALGVIDQHSQVQLYMEGPLDKHVMFLEVGAFGADFSVPDTPGFPEKLSHLKGKSLSALLKAELDGTQAALTDSGRPTSRWVFHTVCPEAVGAFILGWEFVTAIAGELYDIDAFDQPGVELGKLIAHGLLGREDVVELAGQYIDGGAEGAGLSVEF